MTPLASRFGVGTADSDRNVATALICDLSQAVTGAS
jgi:hypothetical protein